MNKNLKRCPFCGAVPIVKKGLLENSDGDPIIGYGVGCTNINCILFLPEDVSEKQLINYVWVYTNLEWLKEGWNTRTKK